MDKLQQSRQTRRYLAVTVLCTMVLLGIMARLYYLQVVKGSVLRRNRRRQPSAHYQHGCSTRRDP